MKIQKKTRPNKWGIQSFRPQDISPPPGRFAPNLKTFRSKLENV